MMLFFIGVVEMVIATAWTRAVTKAQVATSGAVTFVNVIIWYYVLQQIIDDISNWQLVILYAFGCALGTVVCGAYFGWREKSIKTTIQASEA